MDISGGAAVEPQPVATEQEPPILSLEWIMDAFRGKKDKKYVGKQNRNDEEMEEISWPGQDPETRKFREKIAEYNASFTPYNRNAPGFDYITWKPYGYWRDEDHSHTYITQCHALAPWVRATADAGLVGLEERQWEGLVGQPEEALKSQYASAFSSRAASRATSRENLLQP